AIPAFDGTAHLLELAPSMRVRVKTSSTWERFVEVLDTAQPEAPALLARASAGWWSFPVDDTATLAGGRLYFCSSTALAAGAELPSIDLPDPLPPSGLTFPGTPACQPDQDGFSASGDVWVSFHNASRPGLDVYRLDANGPTELLNYSFGRAESPPIL